MKYQKKVWRRDPWDWVWEVRAWDHGIVDSNRGTAASRSAANEAALRAIEIMKPRHSARWVTVAA